MCASPPLWLVNEIAHSRKMMVSLVLSVLLLVVLLVMKVLVICTC